MVPTIGRGILDRQKHCCIPYIVLIIMSTTRVTNIGKVDSLIEGYSYADVSA